MVTWQNVCISATLQQNRNHSGKVCSIHVYCKYQIHHGVKKWSQCKRGEHGTLNPMAVSILYPPQKFNDNSPLGTMWVLSYDPNRDRERDMCMWLNRRALLPTFCLETRSSSVVLSFDAMGWTESCQKARWNQYTTTQWNAWVGTLPEEGFGRLTKIGWREWIQKMSEAHGPSTKDGN